MKAMAREKWLTGGPERLRARARGARREVDKRAARVQARVVVQQLDVARLQEGVQAQLVRPTQQANLYISDT